MKAKKCRKCRKCKSENLTVYWFNGHIKNDYECRDCGYIWGPSYRNEIKVDLGLLDPKFADYLQS